jgi:hypothetical protein
MHLHLIRMRHKHEASLSAKAAFYIDLQPGCIIFSDDTEPSEDLEETIKQATTKFQKKTEYLTVSIDRKGDKKIIPERKMWLFTSVNNSGSDQLSDRQVKCNTVETAEQKNRICEKQIEEAISGTAIPVLVNTISI